MDMLNESKKDLAAWPACGNGRDLELSGKHTDVRRESRLVENAQRSTQFCPPGSAPAAGLCPVTLL